jgi:two-component system LytT family response regulator
MPGGSGFDLLEQVKEINFDFIITTSHEDFAIRAFKFSALDYLLKPINEHELINTINKYINRNRTSINKPNQLEVFLQTMRKLNSVGIEVGLPTTEGVVFVKLENIIRCESINNMTELFCTNNSKITVNYPLREVESLLSEANFLRVQDSHIINLQHIKQYDGIIAVMNDGVEVDISGGKKEEFRKRVTELKIILN